MVFKFNFIRWFIIIFWTVVQWNCEILLTRCFHLYNTVIWFCSGSFNNKSILIHLLMTCTIIRPTSCKFLVVNNLQVFADDPPPVSTTDSHNGHTGRSWLPCPHWIHYKPTAAAVFQVPVRTRRTLAPKVEAVGQNWHVFNTVSRAVNNRFLETEAQTTYPYTDGVRPT